MNEPDPKYTDIRLKALEVALILSKDFKEADKTSRVISTAQELEHYLLTGAAENPSGSK
jgi:hypothetical protein